MFRAGINPIEVLLWSRRVSLAEVISALELVGSYEKLDFTLDSGFPMKSDAKINDEAPVGRVHFEDEDERKNKIKCPQKKCPFLTSLPKNYGKNVPKDLSPISDPGRYGRFVGSGDHKESHGSEARGERLLRL